MASTLNSNSFLLTTPPSTRLSLKINKRLRVSAQNGGPFSSFRLGKSASNSSDEGEAADKGNSSPFQFNFGKVPDVKSLVPIVSKPPAGLSSFIRRKDEGTVFVAGAAGLTGARIAQTLLREGFAVRAGVSDLGAAQELARLAAKYKIISNEESKRLNAVESSFRDSESIAKAIGSASKVVVTVGPGEDGPAQAVQFADAVAVVEAAELAAVGHVVIVVDGNTASSSTYNVLDGLTSFFGNLFAKSQPLSVQQLIQKVVQTDVKYTLIKTSLTEDFSPESAYNVVVSAEGTAGANDYKVAKSQIASVVAKVLSNTAVAENKVVQVTTDPSAPSKSIAELFSSIPEDGRRAAYAETQAKAKAEEEAERASEAAKRAKKLEDQASKKQTSSEDEDEDKAAAAAIEGLFSKAKDIGTGFSWDKLSAQLASATAQKARDDDEGTPKVQVATVRGEAKARTLPSLRAIIKPKSSASPAPVAAKKKAAPPPPKRGKAAEKKPVESRSVFGGLFKQETVYVDDE